MASFADVLKLYENLPIDKDSLQLFHGAIQFQASRENVKDQYDMFKRALDDYFDQSHKLNAMIVLFNGLVDDLRDIPGYNQMPREEKLDFEYWYDNLYQEHRLISEEEF